MTLLLFLLARSLVLHGTISGQSSAPIDCKPDRMADRHADVVVVGMGKKKTGLDTEKQSSIRSLERESQLLVDVVELTAFSQSSHDCH